MYSLGLDQQTDNSRNPQAGNPMNPLPNIGSTQSPTKYVKRGHKGHHAKQFERGHYGTKGRVHPTIPQF